MGLEDQAALAQTVVAGDPSYAGPLAGVPSGLAVFHVFEPEVRDQVPGDVYEAQVALMEMSARRDDLRRRRDEKVPRENLLSALHRLPSGRLEFESAAAGLARGCARYTWQSRPPVT